MYILMLIEFFAVKKKKTFQNFPSLLLSGHAPWKLQHAKMPETVVISLEKKKEEKRNKEQKKKHMHCLFVSLLLKNGGGM